MSVETIEQMYAWVKLHADSSVSLDDVARHVGYSPYYCSTRFREHYGYTLKEFMLSQKCMHAANSLRYTNQSITTIALTYGYSSVEAFSRAFCRHYGMSPRQYRKHVAS